MRVMVLLKADRDSEAGVLPTTELLTAMGKYNEALIAAGVMLAGEGLKPTSAGARVYFSGDARRAEKGPFSNDGQLIAGFWLWQVKSLDEAIDWVKRCPAPLRGDAQIEIRPVFEMADFGDVLTPELQAQEKKLRSSAEKLARHS